jgi:HK97 family phage prohead protease
MTMTVFKDVLTKPTLSGASSDSPMLALPSQPLRGEKIAEGWFTSYGVVDKSGDIGTYGQFAASLERYRRDGKRIAVCENHDWSSKGIIGWADPNEVLEFKTGGPTGNGGLWARVHLLVEDSPAAAFLYRLMQTIPLQCSYAFDSVSERRDSKTGANRLLSVTLLELTICLFGAVEQTTIAAKQRQAISRMPEFKRFVQEKAKRDLDLMELGTDMQDRPHRRAGHAPGASAGGSGYDPVADAEAFFISVGMKIDPASDLDEDNEDEEKDATAYTSESNSGTAEDDAVSPVVEPDCQPRCGGCARFISPRDIQPPVVGGAVRWAVCSSCGFLNASEAKGVSRLTDAQIAAECRKIRSQYLIGTDEQIKAMQAVEITREAQRKARRDLIRWQVEAVDREVEDAIAADRRAEAKALVAELDEFLAKPQPTASAKRRSTNAAIDGLQRVLSGAVELDPFPTLEGV